MALFNLVLFAALIGFLYQLWRRGMGLSRRVLIGLVAGTVYGFYLQFVFGAGGGTGAEVTSQTIEWTNIVANGYVNLLRLIIMPLVLVMMIAAVLKVQEIRSLGKIGGSIVAVLVGTTMIAALVGIAMASLFGLNAGELAAGPVEMARAEVLESRQGSVAELSFPQLLVSFISSNIFLDLTGARDTSIIAVVVFGLLIGVAALLVCEEDSEQGPRIRGFLDSAQAVIMKLVHIVMALTPYGVLALMTRVIATSDGNAIVTLIGFVVASYIAIGIMFAVHALLLGVIGVNVGAYFRKVWPVLTFAFVTRSSAATIPLTIRAQVEELKVPPPVANIAASFGATIGQNGCAGIYPAMLAVMVAPTMGVSIDFGFIASLVLIVAIGSFGIAGVGGGATNAALVVLPAMGFPVTVAALLISIEPLIDMARTALNVNGAITSGMITSRFLGETAEAAEAAAPTHR